MIDLEELNEGAMATRESWAKGTYVYKQINADISQDIIPKMTSVPKVVKEHFAETGLEMKFRNQLAKVHPNGVVNSYLPNSEDLFATDWRYRDSDSN